MKYVVLKSGGKQYKVSEGDIIEVDRLKQEKDGNVVFDEVLLFVNDNSTKIGKPMVTGVKVTGKILDNMKGDKVRVAKFKSKVRFRRVAGFRASLSKVKIEKINEFKEVITAPRAKSDKKKT